MINVSKRAFAMGLLAAAATSLAVAQAAPAPADGAQAASSSVGAEAGRKDGSRWAEHRAKRMDALKQELKLDAKQEDAWNRYTEAMSQSRQPRSKDDRVDFSKLSTPERLDHMRERMAERQERFEQRSDAIKAFYAELTPEQQKIFDERATRGPRRGKHRGHHHRG